MISSVLSAKLNLRSSAKFKLGLADSLEEDGEEQCSDSDSTNQSSGDDYIGCGGSEWAEHYEALQMLLKNTEALEMQVLQLWY
jgi:hypothetical protein